MTVRNHPAGQPARTKISHLVMLALLAGATGQAWAQTVVNDPQFAGNWVFEGNGEYKWTAPLPSSGVSSVKEACIPVSNLRTSLATKEWRANHFHLPGLPSLAKNSVYRLAFNAHWQGEYTRRRASKLVATVSAGQNAELKFKSDLGGGQTGDIKYALTERAGTYVERLLELTGANERFKIDFTTPLGEALPKNVNGVPKPLPAHLLKTDIAFQAWSSVGGVDEAAMCVNSVSLTLIGPNKEEMNPTRTVIRYNQAVIAPEAPDGSTYFTIINPPEGTSLYALDYDKANTTPRPAAHPLITLTAASIHVDSLSGLKVAKVPVNFGGRLLRLELRDSAGRVVAETPMLQGRTEAVLLGAKGPYEASAPDLRRDALHFFYAQRAGQAIVDGRFSEYRNPFSRAAGHPEEVARCFSGVDNFGNDFSGACKTASGRDPYEVIPRRIQGGWYDAGDQGKYVVNGATALWALHNVIEYEQSRGTGDLVGSKYPDGFLKYGTNGVSDLLDEAEYEMRWLLKMQIDPAVDFFARVPVGMQDVALDDVRSQGGLFGVSRGEAVTMPIGTTSGSVEKKNIKLKLSDVNVKGMVFSAVRDSVWTDLPMAPADAPRIGRVLDYPTSNATYTFAAVAAQCARIWKTRQPTLAEKCDKASKDAWNAAERFDEGNQHIYRYGEYTDAKKIEPGTNKLLDDLGGHVSAINSGGGAYADNSVLDAQAWAAWELYLSNSSKDVADSEDAQKYLRKLMSLGVVGGDLGGDHAFTFSAFRHAPSFSWRHNKNMGLMSLLVNGRDEEICGKVTKAKPKDSPSSWKTCSKKPSVSLGAWADDVVYNLDPNVDPDTGMYRSAFGVQLREQPFNWASNADFTNTLGMLLMAAKYVDRDKVVAKDPDATQKVLGYSYAARRGMSYLLGNNPIGKSYITGYGTNPVSNPHHRFWAKHKDISMPPAPPGLLVGGPNGKYQAALVGASKLDGNWGFAFRDPATGEVKHDRGAEKYIADVMPTCRGSNLSGSGMSCYQDDVDSYMTNEVAINWNSALFWVVNFLK